jgi:cobalt/nickel transport system permease protein
MNEIPASKPNAPGRKHGNYLARSLHNLGRFLLDDLATERMARQQGWWQGMNPVLKLISTIGLILMVSLARSVWFPVFIWLLTLLAMAGSRLPVLRIQWRIWGVIPLLTLIISMPAALNVVNPGTPWLWLSHDPLLMGWGIHIPALFLTTQGVTEAVFLFLRVGLSLSLAALLVSTTPTAALLRSLRAFRVPVFVVMIIEMTYRYIVALVDCSLEMFEARQMRTVGEMPTRRKVVLVASSAGSLFGRSMAAADETYLAMTARGYTGNVRVMPGPGLRVVDGGWAVLLTAAVTILIAGGFWLG